MSVASPAGTGVAVALGRVEGARLLRHPLVLVGAALMTLVVYGQHDRGPGDAYNLLTTTQTFFVGVFAYFAAALATSRPRRDGTEELYAATPAPATARTGGLCLAALAPAAAGALVVGLLGLLYLAAGIQLDRSPLAGEVLSGPVTILGGALLGVMVARWAPLAGSVVLVMVGVFAVAIWLSGGASTRWLTPFVEFAVYTETGAGAGFHPGNADWHAAYLLALSAMAACGALLRDARRRLPVLLLGAGAAAVAAVAGWGQLP